MNYINKFKWSLVYHTCQFIQRHIMSDITYMTQEGFDKLNAELDDLKSRGRREIAAAIAEAREKGDLSENAEYHSARERQSFIEGRIMELEAVLSRAEVIDVKAVAGDTIKFGALVTLVDEDTEEEASYQIVGDPEADIKAGRLSVSAPIARALIGKGEGDTIEVITPKGKKYYEVLKVRFA